jgi:hypothetical protein
MAHHFIQHDTAKVIGCIVPSQRLQSPAKANGEAPEAESEWKGIHASKTSSHSTTATQWIRVIRVLLN